MRKAISLTLIACVATALAPATAGAAYKKPKTARFYVSVLGTQVVNWDEPRHDGYSDCQGQRWTRGGGSEVITFRSKRVRALITYTGRGGPLVKLGTWNPLAAGEYAIEAKGGVERTGKIIHGIDPDSRCWDGGPTEFDTGPYDCRKIPVSYRVYLDWGSTIELGVNESIATPVRYDNCPVYEPGDISEGSFTRIPSEPFPAKDLFDRRFRVHEILAAKEFRDASVYHHSSARVTWKVRFERQRSR
jgi:hypothetical protein